MYAIVSTGGKQYKVTKGDVIEVEKLDAQVGDTVSLDVLLVSDDKKLVADAKSLKDSQVSAKVLDQFKGEKQLVFKFKKRKRYHRLKGHRQNLTKLEIVGMPGEKAPSKRASTAKAAIADEATSAKKPAAKKTSTAKKTTTAKKPAAKKNAAKTTDKSAE